MKIWVTKYLFTKGILEVEGEVDPKYPNMLITTSYGYFHGAEWHESKALAVARARTMVAAKRKSVAKTIALLDKLEKELGS